MSNFWENKKILITGCCGTVGNEILNQLSKTKRTRIFGIDNRETEVFESRLNFKNKKNIKIYLGDISSIENCLRFTTNIDIVIHTAAYKHVELCELSPNDAVKNNIEGTQNLISASIKNKVKKFLFTSSDKAVNPTNVMGSTKLLAERLISSANLNKQNSTIFASTRFGNILGSRGSVLKIFQKQLSLNEPFTITDLKMTRYVMTLEKACKLVLKSVEIAKGGEVFILKMEALKILDLAKALYILKKNNLKNFKYKIIGKKNAEKNYEELVSYEELDKMKKIGDLYLTNVNFKSSSSKMLKKFNSEFDDHLKVPDIVKILKKINLD